MAGKIAQNGGPTSMASYFGRQGHMDRLKRIYAYAIRTKDCAVRFRTDQPDYSFLPEQDFDWTYSVYGHFY